MRFAAPRGTSRSFRTRLMLWNAVAVAVVGFAEEVSELAWAVGVSARIRVIARLLK